MSGRLWAMVLVVSLGLNIGLLWQGLGTKRSGGTAPHAQHSACGWHTSPLRSELGLNDKQVEMMERERNQMLVQLRPQQEKLRTKRQELFAMFKNMTLPAAEMDRLLQEIAGLQVGIEKVFITHSLQLKSMFTPDQLKKYEGLFEQGLYRRFYHNVLQENGTDVDCGRFGAADLSSGRR